MNRYFQSVIGREIRSELAERLPAPPPGVARRRAGRRTQTSRRDSRVRRRRFKRDGKFLRFYFRQIGASHRSRGGRYWEKLGEHSSRKIAGELGIFQGYKSLFLQTEEGQIAPTHSISAGLDYPGVGPELAAALTQTAELSSPTPQTRNRFRQWIILPNLKALSLLSKARMRSRRSAKSRRKCRKIPSWSPPLSGRGDKDLFNFAARLKTKVSENF